MITKHTCGGPTFGRKTPGCPRCDELLSGAAPVRWNTEAARQRELAEIRRTAERAQSDRAREVAQRQLDTCCQNRIWTWTISDGMIRQIGVKGCPRHGDHQANIRPVPHLLSA